MNEHFVCIKVDREERPDLDEIYMAAVQAMTGQGGWPLSAWLTPDLEPFYGGTYFPPDDRFGRPGIPARARGPVRGLERAARASLSQARKLTEALSGLGAHGPAGDRRPGRRGRLRSLRNSITTPRNGGWGNAPKFPRTDFGAAVSARVPPHRRRARPGMVTDTLDAMARGGSSTISAVASPATPPTSVGWFRTSRRCSTTTPSSPSTTSRPCSSPSRGLRRESPAGSSTTCCAT